MRRKYLRSIGASPLVGLVYPGIVPCEHEIEQHQHLDDQEQGRARPRQPACRLEFHFSCTGQDTALQSQQAAGRETPLTI